uniref:50S ribosomal protein L28 n=1 Tax=candidate division CPR3 bacterium TaxID=2268181 RepID=A0A7C5UUG9_UNCC3
MAKCEICKKRSVVVKNSRHRQTKNVAKHGSMGLRGMKSSKVIKPNIRKVKIKIDGKSKTVIMCMSCYKRYKSDSSFKAALIKSFC